MIASGLISETTGGMGAYQRKDRWYLLLIFATLTGAVAPRRRLVERYKIVRNLGFWKIKIRMMNPVTEIAPFE